MILRNPRFYAGLHSQPPVDLGEPTPQTDDLAAVTSPELPRPLPVKPMDLIATYTNLQIDRATDCQP